MKFSNNKVIIFERKELTFNNKEGIILERKEKMKKEKIKKKRKN